MQGNEFQASAIEKNDKLISDFAVTKRQSRSLYRNWAIISKNSVSNSQSLTNVFGRISTSFVENNCTDYCKESSSTLIEGRADEIVRHIEQTHALLEDNPKTKNDRLESLREMTEYLTLKRSIKRKLTKSICSNNKTLNFTKRLKYRISILLFKIPITIKHFTSSFEMWYSSLKVIEGHFGSNVASYFKFLRKLFLLNACIFVLMLLFVMIPQLLFRLFQYVDDNQLLNSTSGFSHLMNDTNSYLNFGEQIEVAPLVMRKNNPYEENDNFRLGNLFTGEGFLTNTILFYGYYTNTSLQLVKGHKYNIPAAYFFTSATCYIIIFFFLFTSVAVSYRKRYIEASGGMHNTFSNKIFCGWDFGIAAERAAELKSRSIYIEIKELLDDLTKPTKKRTCINTFYTTAISFSLNGLLLFLLVTGGMYSWKYLDQQMTKADTATTMMMWLILTLVIAVAPVLFSFIAHVEGFESPSSALYMTLIRTFILYAIVVAVVVAFRLNRARESECWETVLGQDMFRLVVLDFVFGSIGTALSEFIRYRIFIKMWNGIGCPEFDIARSTMNLIYNQTLFYIGLFFSPVLSLLITIKLFIIFYVKKWGAIHNCKPFGRPWKASQAHTVYLSIAFFAFFCVLIAYGYIITSVKTSNNCGPFRGEKFMYERLLEELLSNKNSSLLMAFYFITRPGVVGIALMSLVLGVYYMRAVALARIHVVKHLQHLLRLKAEDRKLLLNEISKYTRNQDPPDDESLGGLLNFRSPNYRLSVPVKESLYDGKSEEKFFTNGKLEKKKHTFSSMNDIQCEKETISADRSCIFSSVQNIHEKCNSQNNIELHYRFNQSQNYQDANSEEYVPSISESERCFGYNLSERSSPQCASEIPADAVDVKLSEDASSNSNGCCVSKLNFNPVFTESVPFEADDEVNYPTVNTPGKMIERSSAYDEEKEPLSQHQENVTDSSQSHCKVHERMPSRITFGTSRKKKL